MNSYIYAGLDKVKQHNYLTLIRRRAAAESKVYVPTPDEMEQMDIIIDEVAKYYQINVDTLKNSSRRLANVRHPRQMAMFLIRRYNHNLPSRCIGNKFMAKHHATIIHAVRKISGLEDFDIEVRQEIKDLKNNIDKRWQKTQS